MWRKLRLYSRVSGELSKVPPCVSYVWLMYVECDMWKKRRGTMFSRVNRTAKIQVVVESNDPVKVSVLTHHSGTCFQFNMMDWPTEQLAAVTPTAR